MKRSELLEYLDDYLDCGTVRDFCPNGLQVEGATNVSTIVTAVSASREVFQRARDLEADTVLVHHGIFWKGDPQVLTGLQFQRVRELVLGGLNLMAYHLPLDRHAEVGNNAVAVDRLGLSDIEPFGQYDGTTIGFKGRLPEAVPIDRMLNLIADVFGQEPLSFPEGSRSISTVAVVSGAASELLKEAVDQGIDLFVTGEPREWVMNLARESSINYVAAGHYATERLGVRALGEHLSDRFGLEVKFVDIPNPV